MEALIVSQREGGVLTLTLNRPQARNAFNRAMIVQLMDALRLAAADAALSVVVLTGAGKVFCPGADVKELAALAAQGEAPLVEAAQERTELFRALRNLPKPVIASLNGPAIGGGAGLAMSCDLVIAAEDAYLSYPEVKGGVVPGVILVSLSRLIGPRAAMDLILSGRRLGAAEACQLGLVNRVVSGAKLREETLAYAHSIENPHLQALRYTKSLFNQISEIDYDRALELARDVNVLTRPMSGMGGMNGSR